MGAEARRVVIEAEAANVTLRVLGGFQLRSRRLDGLPAGGPLRAVADVRPALPPQALRLGFDPIPEPFEPRAQERASLVVERSWYDEPEEIAHESRG
jgi:hypothetical protein